MTLVEMKEINVQRVEAVVGNVEAEQVAIERQCRVDGLDMHHRMSHALEAGAEARDRSSRLERAIGISGV